VSSDLGGLGAFPPVVEYSRELQAQMADEFRLLPKEATIEGMLAVDAVMRDQARVCKRPDSR
jgi:hypothetical protein